MSQWKNYTYTQLHGWIYVDERQNRKTYMLFYIYIFIKFKNRQNQPILFRDKYIDSKTIEKTKENYNFKIGLRQ